jgi:secreted Zn-dependent insulinase-like peptidase
VYLQSPEKNLQNQAYTMLVEVMLAGFYFDWMRNQKQLGYQVGTGYMPFNEHPGIALYIQSSVAGPDVLYHETKNGMQHFYAWLQTLNEQQWLRYQHSLVRQLGSNAISFEVRCQHYWSAIGRQPVDFEFEQHLQQVITEIDLSSLSHWFAEMFLQNEKEFCIFTAGSKQFSKGHFKQAMPSIYQFKKGKPGCSSGK